MASEAALLRRGKVSPTWNDLRGPFRAQSVGPRSVATRTRADRRLRAPISTVGEAAAAAELAAPFSLSLPINSQRAPPPISAAARGFSSQRRCQTVEKSVCVFAHRTIPFTVSLSFSSCRMVSCGARLRASSRLMPIANSTPAITAATIAEVK